MLIDTDHLTDLTDTDLAALLGAAYTETQRRHTLATAQTVIETARADWATASGRQDGDPWQPVTGYHDAYPVGAEVTHDGKRWRSTRDGASEEPGTSPDWREIAAEGQIPAWQQPYAGSEYPVGAIVTHKGRCWRNDLGRINGFEPGQTGAGWTDLGPEN